MMRFRYGLPALLCPPLFLLLVLYLQHAQPAYDYHTQFISELALGKHGAVMYLAFASIAIAVANLIPCLRYEFRADSRLRTLLSGLLGTSSFFFALAGAVTLENQTTIHIGSVFISFMALATALFIIFRQAPSRTLRLLSGAALLFSLVALALSNLAYLELGTAQRLMAFSMVSWIAGAGAYFTLKNKPIKTI